MGYRSDSIAISRDMGPLSCQQRGCWFRKVEVRALLDKRKLPVSFKKQGEEIWAMIWGGGGCERMEGGKPLRIFSGYF